MNKTKAIIIAVSIIIVAAFGAYIFQPGVYVNAENYQLKDITSHKELKNRIESLKNNNPQYKAYSEDSVELKSEIDNLGFLTIFVHLPSGKANIFFKTDTKNKSFDQLELKLIGVTRDNIDHSWRWFNTKELSKEENEKYIKSFELEILNKLGRWKRH